jgi:hypothetical protein
VLARTCFVLCCTAVRRVECGYFFTEIVNLQPLIVPDPAKPKTGQDGTQEPFPDYSIHAPKLASRRRFSILRSSSEQQPKGSLQVCTLADLFMRSTRFSDLPHAPVSTVEKQSSNSPTLLPLPDYRIPIHVHRKLHGAFLSPIDSHASQKLRHPVVIDHEHLRVQGPARLSGNGSLL